MLRTVRADLRPTPLLALSLALSPHFSLSALVLCLCWLVAGPTAALGRNRSPPKVAMHAPAAPPPRVCHARASYMCANRPSQAALAEPLEPQPTAAVAFCASGFCASGLCARGAGGFAHNILERTEQACELIALEGEHGDGVDGGDGGGTLVG